jgi:predicted metal-binding protein
MTKEDAMLNLAKLEMKFRDHGFTDFRWIDPRRIVVSQWVRIKCQFGCREYGNTAVCPPQVPTVDECERFFRSYRRAAVFHLTKRVAKPEDRFAWTRRLNLRLWKLERDIFISGHEKAFLLFLDSCNICAECTGRRETCRQPKKARPTPEALAVDVYSTVRKIGYPIQVLARTDEPMNRYAFLLID